MLSPEQMYSDFVNLHIGQKILYENSPFGELINKTFPGEKISGGNTVTAPHYINFLDIGEDALLARIHLIRAARESICIQTYIWSYDESGKYVMKELLDAAKRGVKVNIIVDKLGVEDDPGFVAYLIDYSPNIQIKYYNPSSEQVRPSALHITGEIAFNFKKFNQRMHNKVMIFDDRIAIIGGRNFENDYFDLSRTRNFKDRDVIVTGPVAYEVTESFMKYWAFKLSFPAGDFKDVSEFVRSGSYKKRITADTFEFGGLFDGINRNADDAEYIYKKFIKHSFKVEKVMFIADEPGKNKSLWIKGGGRSSEALFDIISKAKRSLICQTPYLVFDKYLIKKIKKQIKKYPELDIVISTNSLASTDHMTAYAQAFKQKKIFVKNFRFRIFEFKPVPGDIDKIMPNYFTKPLGYFPDAAEGNIVNFLFNGLTLRQKKRYLCVHAKSFVIDDEIAWVGSFNLDPRSVHLNTEVGLVIWDRHTADALKRNILQDTSPRNSWAVGKKENVPIISFFSGLIGTIMGKFPVGDVWPFQYTSLYELKEGMEPVPFYHENFYENYTNLGSFPGVPYPPKKIQLRLMKAFIGIVEPII